MMKYFTLSLFIAFTFSSTISVAYNPAKDSLITLKVNELKKVSSTQEYQKIANDLERIVLVDGDNWLAYYYTSYAYVEMAYLAKKEQIDALCDRAELFLKSAEKNKKADLSEVYALQAYLISARIYVNPMTRGSKMGKESAKYINLAIEKNSKNPRPYLIRALGIYHTPRLFGGGAKNALAHFETATQKYHLFKSTYQNAPAWGSEEAERLLKECKK